MIGAVILQIVLIFLNAIFASAEIAVISTNETKLQKMSEKGDRRAKRLVKLTSQPARFLSTIQVAITLAGFLGSAFAADNFAEPLVEALVGAGVPGSPQRSQFRMRNIDYVDFIVFQYRFRGIGSQAYRHETSGKFILKTFGHFTVRIYYLRAYRVASYGFYERPFEIDGN